MPPTESPDRPSQTEGDLTQLRRTRGAPIPTPIGRACRDVMDAWFHLRQTMAATPYDVRTPELEAALRPERRPVFGRPANAGFGDGRVFQRVWGLAWPPRNGADVAFKEAVSRLVHVCDADGAAKQQDPRAWRHDGETKRAMLEVVDLFHSLGLFAEWHPGRLPLQDQCLRFGEQRLERARQEDAPQRDEAPHDILRWPANTMDRLRQSLGSLPQAVRDHAAARFLDTTADFHWWMRRTRVLSESVEATRLLRHPACETARWEEKLEISTGAVKTLTTAWTDPQTAARRLPLALERPGGVEALIQLLRTNETEWQQRILAHGLAALMSRLAGPAMVPVLTAIAEVLPQEALHELERPVIQQRLPRAGLRPLLLHANREVREAALRLVGQQRRRGLTPAEAALTTRRPGAREDPRPSPRANAGDRQRIR